MSELLPCPFCGGEARLIMSSPDWFFPACMNRECACDWTDSYPTKAEAIEAWNTRHKSVFVTGTTVATDGEPVTYAPTRTCEFNIKDNMNETEGMGDVWIECSACHCVFDFYADEWLMKMSYCPNCGSKVIA